MSVRYNYTYLLAGLLVLVVLEPLIQQSLGRLMPLLSEVAFVAILVLGVWTLLGSKRWFLIGAVLAIPATLIMVLNAFLDIPALALVNRAVILVFCLITVAIALRDVLFRGRVDANKLIGAICVYLLLGVIWALLYLIVETAAPGSFTGLDSFRRDARAQEFIYYSFVTLSTLGYGDISPVAPAALALAYLEAVFGQLYLTILVAGLVGMHIAARPVGPAPDAEVRG